MANRAPQPNAIGHMGWAEVSHQGFASFVLQLFKVGRTDAQLLLIRDGLQATSLIAQHLKQNLTHPYLLGSGLILSGFHGHG